LRIFKLESFISKQPLPVKLFSFSGKGCFILKFGAHFAKNTGTASVLPGFNLPGIAPGSKFCYSK